MFAVIKTGGKQYKVAQDDVLKIEKIDGETGDAVSFEEVLMIGGAEGVSVGTPLIDGATVAAEIIDQGRGDKIYAFKKRRRKHSSKRIKGHRQYLTTVRITGLPGLDGGAAKAQPKKATKKDADAKAAKAKADAEAKAAEDAAAAALAADVDAADVDASLDAGATAGAATDAAPEMADAAPVKPANLLDAPEGNPDDLTKLPGVDADMQMALFEAGVFHYDQIDAWGPGEWAWIEKKIGKEGQINRSGWLVITRKIVTTRKSKTLAGTRPGNLMQVPDGNRDNLERLTGIGKVREEHLYDLGVFHFSQIAAWNDDEKAYVKSWLDLRNNMPPTDEWFDEAKDLAAKA